MADFVQVQIAELEEVEITATIRLSVKRWREVLEKLNYAHPLCVPLRTALRDLGERCHIEIVFPERMCARPISSDQTYICAKPEGHAGPCATPPAQSA